MTTQIEAETPTQDTEIEASARADASSSRRRLLRAAAKVVTTIVALLAVGTTYQIAAAHLDADRYPAPGRLVDVGGFRMHILCTGPEGVGPTLILDHGGGGFGASDWSVVQPELARFARVCSYDRAGYGWSDPSPAPRTVEPETDELERLLENARVAPPYVMVADSLGSYTERLYATRHPEHVVGMVFVDVSTETEWAHPDIRRFNAQFGILARAAQLAAPIGLWRALGETGLLVHPLVPYLPEALGVRLQPLTYRPAYWGTVAEETAIENLEVSARVLATTRRSLGSKPLIVLTAGGGYPSSAYRDFWLADQATLLGLSTRSEQRLFADVSHVTLATERAGDVADAVRDVLAMIGH